MLETGDMKSRQNVDEQERTMFELISNKDNAIDSLSRHVEELDRLLLEARNDNKRLMATIS